MMSNTNLYILLKNKEPSLKLSPLFDNSIYKVGLL